MLTRAPDRSSIDDGRQRGQEQMPINGTSVAQYISGYRSLVGRLGITHNLIYAVEIAGIRGVIIGG